MILAPGVILLLGEKLALGMKLEPVLRVLASASPLGLGAKLGN
jgi:hypothetical protein